MLKNILKLDGAQQLSKNDQKNIFAGRPNPGSCVDSNIDCTNTGNAGCPVNQGCYIQSPDLPIVALCQCIKK